MKENREGQKVPNVSFRVRDNDGNWSTVTTEDLFANKKVVVFALPGAFTPTCSSSHLPRYNMLADDFKAAGVDDILCVSVNDTFVMNAWQEDQGADRITFVPDGNGEFSKGMGMLVDKDDLGGYAHGVSTSVPAGVVDVGAGAWFSYYPIQFLGLAYTAGAGVGAEIGVYNEALTQLYN